MEIRRVDEQLKRIAALVLGGMAMTTKERQIAAEIIINSTAPEALLPELRDAILELATIMGNPALPEAETVREAVRRIRETVGAVKRMRAAGADIPSPDEAASPHLTVVPIVATRKMLEAAGHACDGLDLSKMTRIERSLFKAQKRWSAMLAVAPVPFGPQHALRDTPSPQRGPKA